MKLYLIIAAILFVLDQATKTWIVRAYPPGAVDPVVPGFFDIVHVANTGAAFGMLNQFPWLFLIIKSIALIVLLYLFISGRLKSALAKTIGALLLAGVAGNLTDRLIHGYVVDFLSFDLHIPFANPWPAFNVADSCISIAAILLLIHSFRPVPKKEVACSTE